jgi:PAS domain S-box-containing protein
MHYCSINIGVYGEIALESDFFSPLKIKEISKTKKTPQKPAANIQNKALSQRWLREFGLNSKQFKVLFGNLMQGMALGRVVSNENGIASGYVLLEFNEAYKRIFSFKKEPIWYKSTLFGLKDECVDWNEVYTRVATTRVPNRFEVYVKPKDKWYQIVVHSPKKNYFFAVFIDITRQKVRIKNRLMKTKKTQQELVLAEKKYRRLYETTQDGIMARDLSGRMINCNKAYAKMLGYTKKELKNMYSQDLIPEKWHEQREKVVDKVLQTGRSILFEREYRRKGGSVFPASVRSWRLMNGKGKVIGVWSIVRDITEQKASQKTLEEHAEVLEKIVEERTKQLKDSERLVTIGQTAGMVGHDLRNPLQTIIGELYLAKEEVESFSQSELKGNLKESIRVIEEQVEYMDKIVSDLQAFVQPVRVDKGSLNLKELLTDVLGSVTIPQNVKMQMQIEEELSQMKADAQLLKRVLINLTTNAVQAMPDGGELTLKLFLSSQGQAVITVEDTGMGIPDAVKPKIFTPLFTTKPRGQGFGLAVCKRVIEAHGGTISFESTVGKGTRFMIQMPTA